MADPLLVIVFVAAGGAADATTRAMERATHDALGLEAHVDVHETEIVPSDLDVLVAEQKAHAAAVVELTWAEQGRQARLRVHVARSGRWISRTIGFVPSDADAERGRTIGFAVASMLPEATPEGPEPPEPTPPTSPPPPTPPASAVAPVTPVTVADPARAAVAPRSSGPDAPVRAGSEEKAPAASARAATRYFALDVSGLGTYGLDANAQSAGGRAALHWFFARIASLRLGAGVDGGSLDATPGNVLTALVSGGLALHPWRPTPSRPLGLSVRSEYLLANQSMTNFPSRGAGPLTRSRWISGLDVALDGRWLLTGAVDLILGVGLEELFGRTYVDRMGDRAATLPTLRGFTEVGLGVGF